MKKVVILGGGSSGLSCGWELVNKGYEVLIIEKNDKWGGLCRTVEHNGFRFDLGMHRFISSDPMIINRINDLSGSDMLLRKRRSTVRVGDREIVYPLNLINVVTHLRFIEIIRILKDLLPLFLYGKGKEDVVSLEEWVKNNFGIVLYELIFAPYNRKLWGMDPSWISADWANQRIPSLNISQVLRSLFLFRNIRTFSKYYLYPKFGIGNIFDLIAGCINKGGGRIITSSVPLKVVFNNDKINVFFLKENKEIKAECSYLVSTIPLNDFVSLIGSKHIRKIQRYSKNLKFRSLRFLNIAVNKPSVSNNVWQYVPDSNIIFTRIQEPKLCSPYMVPDVHQTSLVLEVPCNKGDFVWNMSDKLFFSKVRKDLEKAGMAFKNEEIIDYFSTYADNAYPVYTLDYRKYRDAVIDFVLSNYNNIVLCGRQGTFNYLFMDFAMKAGIMAAKFIMGDKAISREDIVNIANSSRLIEADSLVDDIRSKYYD